MAEPGKTLDLDGLLGPSAGRGARSDWRTTLPRLLREHGIRPSGAVHLGACADEDLVWYASAGFGKVLLVASSSTPRPSIPSGLVLLTADDAFLRDGRDASSPHAWDALFAGLSEQPTDFVFFNSPHATELPPLTGGFMAVRRRALVRGGEVGSDTRLGEQGFSWAFVGAASADGHADALYLRRPVVTMSDFGRNGRFGNQLFQRAYLRLVARRQGAILQLPLWAGTALFGTEDPPPSGQLLPVVKEETLDMAKRRLLSDQPDAGFSGMDYRGYGMSHTSLFTSSKEQIRAEHVFDARLTARFDAIMGPLLAGGKKLVVIHLRRGDYGYGQFFRAPCAWYQEWMSRQGFTPATHLLYICSEDPGRYRARFAGFTVVTADDIGTPPQLSPYLDFLAMTRADMLAIANSSFSFFAAMLNSKASDFVRPDAEQGGLVAFDPWGAEPVLDQKLSPEEHRRLKEID